MSLTWRSPAMLPPPVNPADVVPPADPVARLALGAAWRLRAFGHALAHGLRRVPGGRHHVAVVDRLRQALLGSDAFLAHPALSGGEDPERLAQARFRLEPLPNCESWAEVAMADVLYGGALDRGIAALARSSDAAMAEAARAAVPAEPFGLPVLRALAADPRNRQCLQILVDRWLPSACHAFGRPGTAVDADLAARGVRPAALTALGPWLERIEDELWHLGLQATDAQFMGIVAPDGWSPRRRSPKRHD
jgi:1,2-phenylacetyl-CoA epoxidase catalytic subunit